MIFLLIVVIDCYKHNKRNVTVEILNKKTLNKIKNAYLYKNPYTNV